MQSCVYGEPKNNYQCMQGAAFFLLTWINLIPAWISFHDDHIGAICAGGHHGAMKIATHWNLPNKGCQGTVAIKTHCTQENTLKDLSALPTDIRHSKMTGVMKRSILLP